MNRLLRNIISVIYSLFLMGTTKIIHPRAFHCSLIERFSPGVALRVVGGRCRLGKLVRVHSGSKIVSKRNGSLVIGDGVSINNNCYVVCFDKIEIGSGTTFGQNVLLYDHDHDFRIGLSQNVFKTSPITIGKNCWIGANTVILRGTTLGDNCVVGAGSVIKGVFPSKRETIVSSYKNEVE